MKANRAEFTLAAMCRVLGLSTSGYHDWLQRPPSKRAQRDVQLQGHILLIWTDSQEIYGRPRIHAALRAAGELPLSLDGGGARRSHIRHHQPQN